jgi:cell division protein FtsI/penicillin-binding protein 2
MNFDRQLRTVCLLAAFLLAANASAATRKHKRVHAAASVRKTSPATTKRTIRTVVRRRSTKSSTSAIAATTTHGVIHSRVRYSRRRKLYSPWSEPTFADSTAGDNTAGEDPVVRKAAIDALGPYNGAVVVADSATGRILSIVNQKLALTGAFQPCSTIKVVVSLASLSEGVVDPETQVRIARRSSMNLTKALAMSNNAYFARLGEQLGFERVEHYAQMFGLGEKAGLDIEGEEPGTVVSAPPSDGVGMMTSFGSGIRLTPLELTSIVSTVANGGTMYYLQYPRTQEQMQAFQPQVKRYLSIGDLVPAIKPGMMGAVEYGTARRASYNQAETLLGKTGTCTDTTRPGVHLGWFGSFNDVGKNKLAVVVLLTGGRGVSGPVASGIAGQVYRNLDAEKYFGPGAEPSIATPISLVSMP